MQNNDHAIAHVKNSIEKSLKAKQSFWSENTEKVVQVAQMMGDCVLAGGKILIFGNGGSAADSQHLAAEMVGRMLVERKKPVAAIALTTDTSALTAIGNDYHFDDVFSLQVKALAKPGDLCIAISTSGNSKNVVKAAYAAKELGAKVVSLTGGKGGVLRECSDVNLNVSLGENSSMIQETHISVEHALVDLMDRFFLNSNYV